jgi:hypothetical protein
VAGRDGLHLAVLLPQHLHNNYKDDYKHVVSACGRGRYYSQHSPATVWKPALYHRRPQLSETC